MNFNPQKLEKIDHASISFEVNVIKNINEALGFKITHCECKNYFIFKRYKIYSVKTVMPCMAEVIAEINRCTIADHNLVPLFNFLNLNKKHYPKSQLDYMMEVLFEKNREIEDQIKIKRLFRF